MDVEISSRDLDAVETYIILLAPISFLGTFWVEAVKGVGF